VRVAFDSNILVYAVDNQAGARRDAAADLLIRATPRDAVLALQVLGEFLNVVTRKLGVSKQAAADHIADWRSVFPVVAPGATTMDRAIGAAIEHDLQFWDAMLWATVDDADCDVLFSEDFQDGRQLGRVQFINPFDPANHRLVNTVLPPVSPA
jgi:predicted nucleic acid-binding protein